MWQVLPAIWLEEQSGVGLSASLDAIIRTPMPLFQVPQIIDC